ncbi:hypothetical protein D9M71_664800 [compost metagenome]
MLFDPRKVNPDVDTAILDYMRNTVLGHGSLKDDFGHALVGFASMITDQVIDKVEQAALQRLGLTPTAGRPYYAAYMKAKASGYRESFENFALLIKQVQG